MAGKGYSTIQLLEDDEESDEELLTAEKSNELSFQDFSNAATGQIVESLVKSTLLPSSGQESDEDENDKSELLSSEKKAPSFWTFEYYQAFFDVDTQQVVSRIVHSIVPSKENYLLTKIRPNPDLYGPFWICATLVLTIAICGNLSSFFANEGDHEWKSDFRLVSISASVIFSYAWLVPAALWGFLIWRGNLSGYSFLEIVCVYGYSLAVFIPISILWLIPYEWVRWILVLVGAITSGLVLIVTFWKSVEHEPKKIAVVTTTMIFVLHTLLAIGFKLYFFRTIAIHHSPTVTSSPTLSTAVRPAAPIMHTNSTE